MIKAAAILLDGVLHTGKRHHLIIADIVAAGGSKPVKGTQGFVTDKGEFVNRVEAVKIAFECGQIKKIKPRLYSEDL